MDPRTQKLTEPRKPLFSITKNEDNEFWLHIATSSGKQAGINLGCFPPGRVATDALEIALTAQPGPSSVAAGFVTAWREVEEILYGINCDKGFMTPGKPVDIGMQLALIHSEVSEGVEAYRKDLNDDKLTHRKGLEVELADAVIRIFNLAAHLGLDIPAAMVEKTAFNAGRPYMHGGKKC